MNIPIVFFCRKKIGEKASHKMMAKLIPVVNFINVFTYKFFVRTLFRQLFLVTFWLWRQNFVQKRVHKMLIKLIPDDTINWCRNSLSNFILECWFFFGVSHLATCIFLSFQLLNEPGLGTLIDLAWFWHHFHLVHIGWDKIWTHDLSIVNLVCYPLDQAFALIL